MHSDIEIPPTQTADASATAVPLLRLDGLAKTYASGSPPVFDHVDLTLQVGEVVALLGESGVGKSTLLNAIAGLDRPDRGRIVFDGADLTALDDDALARWRRASLGFVFQAFHVLPHLTVAQNVALPLRLLGRVDAAAVDAMVDAAGLAGLGARWPAELSGGQLQRVAIARALVHRPRLVLADEPTGNLDPTTAGRVTTLLTDAAKARGTACLIVTHSIAVASAADRVLRLRADGIVPA